MMSANSFLDNIIGNTKRRLWVWALSFFALLIAFPGVLTIYFTRVDSYVTNGNYWSELTYRESLIDAVYSMLYQYPGVISAALAIVIGLQGFSYLFSKRKVDMYHSVPVSMKKRFAVIYINGILAYVIPLLVSNLIAIVMVLFRGIISADLISRYFAGLGVNLLIFLAVYHLSIFSVSLTGNLFMAIVIDGVLIFYANMWTGIITNYMADFFKTKTTVFETKSYVFSISDLGKSAMYDILRLGKGWDYFGTEVLKYATGLLIWATVGIVLAYYYYKKRPSEAAGSSIAFYASRIIIKLMIVVPATLMFARWIYYFAEQSRTLMVISLVLATVIISMLIEILFNLDFISSIRHWGSIVVALILVGTIYVIFAMDLFGYDRYIPNTEDIESYAILNNYESYYSDYIDFSTYENNEFKASNEYIDCYKYAKDHMFNVDAEAIVELAKKAQSVKSEDMGYAIPLEVYYRLKNGKTRSRVVMVDVEDESNDDLLNRIIGPAHYKSGIWQAMEEDIPEPAMVREVKFYDGMASIYLPMYEANHLISLWREDMSKYDYDRVRYDEEIGYISVTFTN